MVKRGRDVTALARTFAMLAQAAVPPQDSSDLIRHLASAERGSS